MAIEMELGYDWERMDDSDTGRQYVAYGDREVDEDDEFDEQDISMVCELEPNLWGWYNDSNPAFLFNELTAIEVLALSSDDAHTLLMSRVTPDMQRRGCPWYV